MKKRERIELNITPLIDIVFILFTFFLVATSFKSKEAKLNISIAGRLVLYRSMGKLAFGQIQDEFGRLQICFQKDQFDIDGLDAEEAAKYQVLIEEIDHVVTNNPEDIAKMIEMLLAEGDMSFKSGNKG